MFYMHDLEALRLPHFLDRLNGHILIDRLTVNWTWIGFYLPDA